MVRHKEQNLQLILQHKWACRHEEDDLSLLLVALLHSLVQNVTSATHFL